MSPRERTPLSEVASANAYSIAREILDLYGHPGIRPTFRLDPRPGGGPPRISNGLDIPITEAPIVSVQIVGNECRLWLRSKDDSQSENRNGAIELSVHFQERGFDKVDHVDHDSEGYATGYWYKPSGESELKHVGIVGSSRLPKELDFSWYLVKTYSIEPNNNSSKVIENVPPEVVAGIGDDNEFLLEVLKEMQTKFKASL